MANNNIYGYLTEPVQGDKNNLTADFNYRISKIYTNLLRYYDKETVMKIYPRIYTKLYEELLDSVKDNKKEGVFFILNSSSASLAVEHELRNIDPFSELCILSKGTFNSIQKDIVRGSLPSIISSSLEGSDYNTIVNGSDICRKHNISRAKYSLERLKATIEMSKCKRQAKKESKRKALALK